MKLYWYELRKDKIVLYECEVEETEKLYKCLDGYFPYKIRSRISKEHVGEILGGWGAKYVFFTEKNLEKARDLFVKSQENLIKSKKRRMGSLEHEVKVLERQIQRLQDMEV